MEQFGRDDIHADRHVPCFRTFAVLDYDFTGAAFAAQVRTAPEATGSPLIDLSTTTSLTAQGVRLAYAGSDTVENHIIAGRLDDVPEGYELSTVVTLSLISIQIVEATMEGLPFAATRANDLTLSWDLHITPSGGVKDKYLGGLFVVRAGVTAT